ncbi:pyridoxamine 5'-phosphate oxidase family protein [bacterium]|nr:pyridoxamine 5'-phosphate oxidase family protein [bacterium]
MTSGDEPVLDARHGRQDREPTLYKNLKRQIEKLLRSQPFCVLCTQGQGQPYGSLIAYACSDDLRNFYFTTPKATRKHRLLAECGQVALVIDSRSSGLKDMKQISAVTVTGRAVPLENGQEYEAGKALLKERHPYLQVFLEAESTALFRVDVIRYFHVTRFQEVSQWVP